MKRHWLIGLMVFLGLEFIQARDTRYDFGRVSRAAYNVGTCIPEKKSVQSQKVETTEQPQTANKASNVSVTSDAQVTSAVVANGYVIVSDANFRKLLIALYDTNKDKRLSEEEALAVKTINMSNSSISNLSGIEAFSNLETLVVRNNKFSKVDLSKNLKLKTVYVNSDVIQTVYVNENCSAEFDVSTEMIVRVKSK